MQKPKKSRQQMSLSHRGSQPNVAQRYNLVSHSSKKEIRNHTQSKCRFCCCKDFSPLYQIRNKLWPLHQEKQLTLIKLLRISLPLKYSQSQTYYYTKPINDFLNNQRSTHIIKLKELISFTGVDGDEWMRRFYSKSEQTNKIKLLTEYYRFHNEIPRLFMLPISDIMNNFHDKKRRIEYFRIVKEIEDENKKNPDKPPKEIVGDKPEMRREDSLEFTQGSKVLEDKFYGNLLDDLTLDQSKNIHPNKEKNVSLTVQELNQKLEEIVQGQKIAYDDLERDFKFQKQTNDEDDKLAKFLSFLKDKDNENFKPKEKQKYNNKKTSNLKLDEEALKVDFQQDGPKTVQPIQKDILYQIDRKTGKIIHFDPITKQSPQSARNGNQIKYLKNFPIFFHFSNPNIPFFLSDALVQKLQSQQPQIKPQEKQNEVNLKQIQGPSQTIQNISQALQVSPRNTTSSQQQLKSQIPSAVQSPANINHNSLQKQGAGVLYKASQQQIITQQIQQSIQMQLQAVKQSSTRTMIKQLSAQNIHKVPMQQGFQGSQEAYQIQSESGQNPILSAKNSISNQPPSSEKINSVKYILNNVFFFLKKSLKNVSKLSAMITAESSPSHKIIHQQPVIGSQTHRVTSQANVYRQSKKFDSNSKESLNKLLSPINPLNTKKEINDNFILQIQSLNHQQSSISKPLIKSTVVAQQKISNQNQVRRGTKGPQFRKSLEQNIKIQQSIKQNHQHAKSEINNLAEQAKRFQ